MGTAEACIKLQGLIEVRVLTSASRTSSYFAPCCENGRVVDAVPAAPHSSDRGGLPVDCEIDEGFMYPLVGLAKCKLWAC